MKSVKLKKIAATVVAMAVIISTSPMGVSAAWKQDSNNNWKYEDGDNLATGWKMIDGKWYKFNESGNMQTGWINDNGKWYYALQNGEMKTGWINDNGAWYYTTPSGEMKTGWINDNGKWYYSSQNGAIQTGWVNDNGTWYYTSSSGEMKTGWVNDNGTWYYTASNGAMQIGVVEVENKVYSLSQNGAMQTGNVMINGEVYNFSPTGECVGDKTPTPTKAFTQSGQTVNKEETNNNKNNNSGDVKDNTKATDTDSSKSSSSSGSKKHHNNSGSSESKEVMSKLNITNNDISFDYNVDTNTEYNINCEIYNENNKIIDTIKWDKVDNKNGSQCSIRITDILGEMNENSYIISKITPKKGNSAKITSPKMQVLSSKEMNLDLANINAKVENADNSYKLTLTNTEDFLPGTYVVYGHESKDSAYVATTYCPGNVKILEFNGLNYRWANGEVSKLKLVRIHEAKQDSNGAGSCEVEFTNNFDLRK
ncbi:N-acetylmuramoyl-L-alanine amidase family protein [Clostridium weizhouense]|uniref:N-acetylmuramoyl-L-alanine amidase family protein n=1 Tax=Clostridium weizhouense TaxID=2859781 RepID=A0ABS7AUM9_9CLOT|nr:N-acetylmuramoyl-L-alanine amidase family protein [Clostridium weizhouense]MBW6411556.1 N-acetylmuramoyl-L-alanine amidase family protein [Clostridium weizhouense]